MSGIRWRPTYIVQAQSPEVKKTFQIYRFGRSANFNCCRINNPIIIKYNILDGGIPFASGPAIKDGGIPFASGPKLYDGGNP
jgi:hypothetical protein